MKFLGLFIILCLFGGNFIYSQQKNDTIIEIKSADDLHLIGKKIEYFEDIKGELTITDILKKEFQSKFQPSGNDFFAKPASKSVFWFRFSVTNASNRDVWLEVGSTYAWYIDLFRLDSNQVAEKVAKTGTMRPESSKFIKHNLFWLPLNKANQKNIETYYLKITASLPLELPLHVGTIKSLAENSKVGGYLTAGFIGVVAIIFLYSLFIFLSTHDKIYIWYLGYLLLMGISMPYANSYPFIQNLEFWFIDKTWWNNYFLVWHAPVYFFVGMFCIKYLNLKESLPAFYKLIIGEIILLAVISPLLLVFVVDLVQIINIFQVGVLLLYLSCLFSAYYLMFKGHKYARYYALGWTFMIVHVFIFFATVNGFFPFNNFTRNSLYVGVGLEVWMFSLALGDRINLIRKEKEETQKKYIELVESQNDTLTNTVAVRTEELKNALEEIEAANSELIAQAENLAEYNKTKDKLLSIIGHDLKAPIGQVKIFLKLFLEENMEVDELKKHAVNFQTKVDNIFLLLDNLLQWANSQREGISARPVQLELKKVVNQTIVLLSKNIEIKQISIDNQIVDDVKVYFDETQLNIVLLNLLNNAIKFTHTNGNIIIEAKVEDSFVRVTIADTGIGMDEETKENLFNPYAQVSKQGTDGEAGTGLGLVVCKDFIESNKGKIWVKSTPGEGSTFYFTIPSWQN